MQSNVSKPAQPQKVAPALTAAPGSEERFAKRKKTMLPAKLGNHALSKWLSCKILNTSSSGALVQVSRSSLSEMRHLDRYLNELTLSIPVERTSVECRLIWRDNDMLGIEYTRPVRKIAKPVKLKPREPQPKGLMASVLNKARVKPL